MGEVMFTPGPWRLSDETSNITRDVLAANGKSVGSAWNMPIRFNFDKTEIDANAHLIAAAPDLYEALATARMALIAIADSAVEAGFDRMADIIDGQLVKANNALARARGESQ